MNPPPSLAGTDEVMMLTPRRSRRWRRGHLRVREGSSSFRPAEALSEKKEKCESRSVVSRAAEGWTTAPPLARMSPDARPRCASGLGSGITESPRSGAESSARFLPRLFGKDLEGAAVFSREAQEAKLSCLKHSKGLFLNVLGSEFSF